jgi:hypothetical protein
MKKLTTLFLLLTLIACGPAVVVTPTVSPSPSSTSAQSTATSTSAPTPTSTPIAGAPIERCAKILPNFPEDSIPSGTLVVQMSEGLSLLDFRQQTTRLIPGDFYTVGTSPNGKWLSYVIFTPVNTDQIVTMDLVVESTDGEKQAQLPFDVDWIAGYWIPWLDNERIRFLVDKVEWNPPTLVLNPFTDERQVFFADYPNFHKNYYGPVGSWPLYFDESNVSYDPSLRYVVYPEESDNSYTTLWDRETNQTVAKIYTGGLYGPLPL